jgi:DNA polymerase-3 subunit delta'
LLPTIRSRCRRLMLRPLAEEVVVGLLAARHADLAAADAQAIARLSEGSIGRALALVANGGLALYRDMVGLIGALPRLDIGALHAFADTVVKSDEGFRTLCELFGGWLAAAASRADRTRPEVVGGEADLQRRLVKSAGLDRWVEVWEKTSHMFGRADAVNLDRKLVLVNAFLALERLSRP